MRNEIYNKIRQNKMQYYAELKKQGIKSVSEIHSENQKEVPPQDKSKNTDSRTKKMNKPFVNSGIRDNALRFTLIPYEKVQRIRMNDVRQKIRMIFPEIKKSAVIIYKGFISFCVLIKQGFFLFINSRFSRFIHSGIVSTGSKIRQTNERITYKIEQQTDKLAYGIYNASSGFFEDKEENGSDQPELTERTSDAPVNSFEWEISGQSSQRLPLTDRIVFIFSNIFKRIKTMPSAIRDFFTTDHLPDLEELNLSGMK